MSYQPRSSTEREPSVLDGILALVVLAVVAACFAYLWSDSAGDLCWMLVRWVARG